MSKKAINNTNPNIGYDNELKESALHSNKRQGLGFEESNGKIDRIIRKNITKKHLIDEKPKKKKKKGSKQNIKETTTKEEESDNETSRYMNFKSKKEKGVSKY